MKRRTVYYRDIPAGELVKDSWSIVFQLLNDLYIP